MSPRRLLPQAGFPALQDREEVNSRAGTTRIAAWSGPRNVSTALMRSFEARGDCAVVDEPLYAAFLAATGKDHPGRDEILRSQPTDPDLVMDRLRAAERVTARSLRSLAAGLALPGRKQNGTSSLDDGVVATPDQEAFGLVYEKHMAHHWQPGWDWGRFGPARHLLLIRNPERVVASYARVREAPVPEDLGFPQQIELLDRLGDPVVVDGDELLLDPPAMLARTCAALGVPYTDRMLSWPAGRRATDGVWAPYWYDAVERSTGFSPPRSEPAVVPDGLRWVVDAVWPAWERLSARRIRVPSGR